MSDLARVYANGHELAIGGQTGGLPEVNGKEKATRLNADLSVTEVSGKEKSKLP